MVIKDEDDLYANLPLGAAKLEGKLLRSGELTVDMDLVGRYEAAEVDRSRRRAARRLPGRDALRLRRGGRRVRLPRGDRRHGRRGRVARRGRRVRAVAVAERETLKKSGDEAACARATPEDKAPPDGCGALVRLEVVPIGAAPRLLPTCPDGTQWNGSACLANKLVTEVDCPAGATWSGRRVRVDAGGDGSGLPPGSVVGRQGVRGQGRVPAVHDVAAGRQLQDLGRLRRLRSRRRNDPPALLHGLPPRSPSTLTPVCPRRALRRGGPARWLPTARRCASTRSATTA